MSDNKPTLDQCRAKHAWKAVEHVRTSKDAKEFAREAKRLPVRIRTASLGQALAFLVAKSKSDDDARGRLLVTLGDWLLRKRGLATRSKDAGGRQALISAIIEGDANLLRRATEEALLYLQWLTRFSEAEIGTGEEGGNAS